ncbi:MAG: ABC transporter ATP-binding protein [Aridibacter famidurans]|nr:ABC transporter ATP-binding protein [Aridibacter famidurans]
MNTAIKLEKVSKAYEIGQIGSGTLSRDIERWVVTKVLGKEDPFLKLGERNVRDKKGESSIVWSLRDIDLEIKQGDRLGIIGKNGAGKSTLLKLLSRVTSITSGEIKIRGKVASLLEVGTGFHRDLTGRENVYLNGAILGMRKKEIDRKLDEIVSFSGVERYIDTPVKRYSSGMYVRLAFAVAAHLDSDILIVDEVLAVGDLEFQHKCLNKMEDVATQGRTVLFVSHNMASVKELCTTGIVLKDGMIDYSGDVVGAIQHYTSEALDLDLGAASSGVHGWVRICGMNGQREIKVLNTESFEVLADLSLEDNIERIDIQCIMENAEGAQVVHNRDSGLDRLSAGIHRVSAEIPEMYLRPGVYTLYFKLIAETEEGSFVRHLSDRLIVDVSDDTAIFSGKVSATILPPVEWNVDSNFYEFSTQGDRGVDLR